MNIHSYFLRMKCDSVDRKMHVTFNKFKRRKRNIFVISLEFILVIMNGFIDVFLGIASVTY